MTCSYCLTPLAIDARFCHQCGRPAPEAEFDPEGEAEPLVAASKAGCLGMLVVMGLGIALMATGLNPWLGLPLAGLAVIIWLAVWFVPFSGLNFKKKGDPHDDRSQSGPGNGPGSGSPESGAG